MSSKSHIACLGLVFCSGFACLVYEVLWMKQLGLLFGNTSHAAAATLCAFFAGIGAGSWFWGRRSAGSANPLRVYALLEAGIAVCALIYFVILRLYHALYPSLYQTFGHGFILLLVKFCMALLLVFPAALFMGGTFPIMGQHLVRSRGQFGRRSAALYGINTLGAALGAFMAGFFLPLCLGFRGTFLGTVALTSLIAVCAFALSRRDQGRIPEEAMPDRKRARIGVATGVICLLSGFAVLALEVVWTRMFSQVFENSVYTFAAVLVTVLACLGAGAAISSLLAGLNAPPLRTMSVLMVLCAAAVGATPFIFMKLTDNLAIVSIDGDWLDYIGAVFGRIAGTIALPCILLGTVFPFLMKIEEQRVSCPGRSLGRLAAVNTAGAILGSLLSGFVMLQWCGMWHSMQLVSIVYLVVVLALPVSFKPFGILVRIAALILLLGHIHFINPGDLPVVSVNELGQGEELIEQWEGSGSTVSVTRDRSGLAIKLNSHYGLGSTGAAMQEIMQADIPLKMHPAPEKVFFLGAGTGITAGTALDDRYPVKKIVTCELVPEVLIAARKYFTDFRGHDFTGGLFSDPRSTVIAEDGRHYLMGTDESFDLIDADLFVPYRSGAGSLYTTEHFETVKKRLRPGGVFYQWLPLYMVTEKEFSIIAKTMLVVFDQVSLWRGNFYPHEEVAALAGHRDAAPFPHCDIDTSVMKARALEGMDYRDTGSLAFPLNAQTVLLFYCGNLTPSRELFAKYPINTDDRPFIEYLAPKSLRDRGRLWFTGHRMARLVETIQERCPAREDPLLSRRTPENRRLPKAGAHFHRAHLWQVAGEDDKCEQAWKGFRREWLNLPGDDQ